MAPLAKREKGGLFPSRDVVRTFHAMPATESKTPFARPLRIGSLEIPNRVLLAPLAGVSDAPFRRICQEMGAGLTYVEMLSSASLQSAPKRESPRLRRDGAEPCLGVQITGPSAESVAAGVTTLDAMPYDTIDINMGCPVRKITAHGAGCAILRDPERVSRTVTMAMARTSRPLTAKIRLGYDVDNRNAPEIVRRLAAAGVAMICIHGRTRTDNYGVPADLQAIAAAVAVARAEGRPDLVVVGNGDIFDPVSALRMLETTGCDAVMVSRGALGNPWVFRHLLDPAAPHPLPAEWRAVILRHLEYHCAHYGDVNLAVRTFRKHLLWYARGFPFMRRAREALSTVPDVQTIVNVLDHAVAETDPGLHRYATEQHAAGGHHHAGDFEPKHDMDRHADRAVANDDHG
ncbi:MAG: tRNA-dihydrouridine synthase [Verrucomicrobia bacterium]|nr:tRNA-dihydrouridine synthase [Verrucomicrobiota bacterium]